MLTIPKRLLLLSLLIIPICVIPGLAEVHLTKDDLTINVKDVTIQEILQSLKKQGQFTIVALEETNIGNVTISKKFRNLSIQEGLDRILSGWNYGISRNRLTGEITTLYLASRRNQAAFHAEISFSSGWHGAEIPKPHELNSSQPVNTNKPEPVEDISEF